MARYDLSDEAWFIIYTLLPDEPTSPRGGRPWAEHRKIINGMFWVLCSGAPWRDLPELYDPWKTVYNGFNRCSNSGFINIISNNLLSLLDANGLVDWSATALVGSKGTVIGATLGFKSMKTAYATIKGIEVMRALRKGQASAFIMVIPWARCVW